jgi:hypothetical protein
MAAAVVAAEDFLQRLQGALVATAAMVEMEIRATQATEVLTLRG